MPGQTAPGQAPSGGAARAEAARAEFDQVANVFGALALVVADQTADAVGEAAGRSESAAAALSALLQFLDAPSVDLLRQVLGLTSSGTVRLIDRLRESGHVERGPGPDGRTTSVRLTGPGREAAAQVAAARAGVLDQALSVLTPAEREEFGLLAGKVLIGMTRGPGAVRWICRLCEVGACRAAPGGCPIVRL